MHVCLVFVLVPLAFSEHEKMECSHWCASFWHRRAFCSCHVHELQLQAGVSGVSRPICVCGDVP